MVLNVVLMDLLVQLILEAAEAAVVVAIIMVGLEVLV